jgi:hypothetical protein
MGHGRAANDRCERHVDRSAPELHSQAAPGVVLRHVLSLATLAVLGGAACCSHPDVWSFSLTREFYSGDSGGTAAPDRDQHREYLSGSTSLPPEIGGLVLVIFAAPVVIDVAILPVTGVHDVLLPVLHPFHRSKEDDEPDGPMRPPLPPPRPQPVDASFDPAPDPA